MIFACGRNYIQPQCNAHCDPLAGQNLHFGGCCLFVWVFVLLLILICCFAFGIEVCDLVKAECAQTL